MKRRCGDLLLALLFVWATLPTALAQPDLTDSEIAKLLEIRVTYAKGGVGIVAGIVDERGARVIAYGKPSKESTQTVDGDSVFEIGSISKVFTAILLADKIPAHNLQQNRSGCSPHAKAKTRSRYLRRMRETSSGRYPMPKTPSRSTTFERRLLEMTRRKSHTLSSTSRGCGASAAKIE